MCCAPGTQTRGKGVRGVDVLAAANAIPRLCAELSSRAMKEINDLTDIKKRVDIVVKRRLRDKDADVWMEFGLQIDRVRWAVRELEKRYKALLKKDKGQ